MNILRQILNSFSLPFRGFYYILKHPDLWLFVIIPAIINMLLSIVLLLATYLFISNWLTSLIEPFLAEYLSFLLIILNILVFILLFVFYVWVWLHLAMIVAAPFNGYLADHVLDEKGIEVAVEKSGYKLVLWEIKRAVLFELNKLWLSILMFLTLFGIGFIPIAGSAISTGGGYVFFGFMTSLDIYDPYYARQDLSFRAKLLNHAKSTHRHIGLSIISALILPVPILGALYLPFALVGGMLGVEE
jgi:CysZ protein